MLANEASSKLQNGSLNDSKIYIEEEIDRSNEVILSGNQISNIMKLMMMIKLYTRLKNIEIFWMCCYVYSLYKQKYYCLLLL